MTPPRWFVPQVTLGNIISLVGLLIAFVVGYAELKVSHNNLVSNFNQYQANEAKKLDDHMAYDNLRFTEMSTKEVRAMRDKAVDDALIDIRNRLRAIEESQLQIINQTRKINRAP